MSSFLMHKSWFNMWQANSLYIIISFVICLVNKGDGILSNYRFSSDQTGTPTFKFSVDTMINILAAACNLYLICVGVFRFNNKRLDYHSRKHILTRSSVKLQLQVLIGRPFVKFLSKHTQHVPQFMLASAAIFLLRL